MLMSGSREAAGIFNYTVKRDWRRFKEREMRSEGYDWFCPDPAGSPAVHAKPPGVDEPITVIAVALQGNRKFGVIAGTKTRLFRYFALDSGWYYDGVGTVNAYIDDSYFDNTPGVWVEIGSGFSPEGKRWEAIRVNGYLVLNNGVDLPVTYRVQDLEVFPIYELREQGIAYVGTIAEHDSILCCFDITQIKAERHTELMTAVSGAQNASMTGVVSASPVLATVNSGVAGVAGNTITATSNAFNGGNGFTGMVGRKIRMANGLARTITAVTSAIVATISGASDLAEPNQPFYLPSATNADYLVSPPAATLFPDINPDRLIGLRLFWDTGEVVTITGIDQPSGKIIANSDGPIVAGPVSVENPDQYAAFNEQSNIERFAARMLWGMPGQPRRFGSIIPCIIDPTSNIVMLKYPVRSIEAGQDLLLLGAAAGGGNLHVTAQFVLPNQVLVSDSQILTSAAQINDDIALAQDHLESAQSAASSSASTLAVAQDALDAAKVASEASPDDADLKQIVADASAKVDAAMAAQKAATDNVTTAQTTLETAQNAALPVDSELQAADAEASIISFEDLPTEGGAILKALTLRSVLLAYDDIGSIFILKYTGSVDTPFTWDRVPVPDGAALFYRHSLICVAGLFHLYAAKNAFYRFDLTNRLPIEMVEFVLCDDIFFKQSKGVEDVFAVDNTVTKEIFVYFPSVSDDKAIRYDYLQGTVSTTSVLATSAARIIRPGTENEVWFVMGSDDGTVLRYGRVTDGDKPSGPIKVTKASNSATLTATDDFFDLNDVGKSVFCSGGKIFAISAFTDAQHVTVVGAGAVTGETFLLVNAIWHRAGEDYDSILESGLESFGAPDSEKTLIGYVPFLSSSSPNTPLQIAIRGAVNPGGDRDVVSTTIPKPKTNNLVKLAVVQFYLGDRITVSGINNPCELSSRLLDIIGVNSQSFGRRQS
jgi:hypothetical protein